MIYESRFDLSPRLAGLRPLEGGRATLPPFGLELMAERSPGERVSFRFSLPRRGEG